MASNNTISWYATYEILTYFRRELWFASQIQVSTPQWLMSIFLLKSGGGTLQNIRFKVYVILTCPFTANITIDTYNLGVSLWSGSCFPNCTVPHREFVLFLTSHIKANLCKISKVRQSRNLLRPVHGLLVSKPIGPACTNLIRMWNKLGGYGLCVYRTKNNADANEAGAFAVEVEPNKG